MENILVTGSTGFIGRNIVKYLSEKKFNVYGTFRNTKPSFNNAKYINCDLSRETPQIENIDIVIHCAGEIRTTSIDVSLSSNVDTTRNIVKFCKDNKVKRLIYFSTCSIYGETDKTINEESPRINPDNYSMTKFIGEEIVVKSQIENILILRIPKVIGCDCSPNDPWIPLLASKLLQNKDIIFYNPEKLYNSVIHVDDICEFIFKLAENNSGIYCLANFDSLKVIEIIEILRKTLKSSSKLVQISPKNNMEHPFSIDITKAMAIGFKTMSLEQTLTKFGNELLNNY